MNLRVFFKFATLILVACGFAAAAGKAQAITVGELADFTGSNNGWRHGLGNWQTLSGGQDGPTDDYLFMQATGGGGALSRLATLNTSSEWTGDYTAAGVASLQFDVLNDTGNTLDLRFAIDGAGGRFSTTNSATISSSALWQTFSLPFEAADFTAVDGGSNVTATLASAFEVRLIHNPSPAWRGVPIVADVGIDNIEALGASFDPADFNEDNFVDGMDLATWTATYADNDGADANGDGVTDGDDFIIWQQNFAPEVPEVQAVPEPSSLVALTFAGFAVLTLRRRP